MKKRALSLALATSMLLVACTSGGGKETTKATTDVVEETTMEGETTTEADSTDSSSGPEWKAYDELIQKIYTEIDLAEREALMHEAEDMLMDTGAIIPLYHYNDLYLMNPAIENVYSTLSGTKYFMYAKKDGQPFGQFKINLASEPAHLDPALNTSNDGGILAAHAFVGLYTDDKAGNIVPALADGQPTISEDGKEYTIKMKSDLKWSDGSPLTANDFVYSWKRAADPNTGADYAYFFDVFEMEGEEIAVSATDDTTLTFKLKVPVPYMMTLLTFPTYMPVPQAAVEAEADWENNPGAWAHEAGFVSNGAYTLKEWKHNESMVYVKNPNFYDAANVTVDELHLMLSADDTAILAAYQAGDLDFADTVPTGEVANLKSLPDWNVVPLLGTYYVSFNVKSDIFNGKTVEQAKAMRQAFTYLIDRNYIVDTIAQTGQEPATTYIPSGMSNSNGGVFKENDADYTYPVESATGYYDLTVNQEKAVELLKEAGFEFDDAGMLSESTPLTLNYLTNEGTGHEAIAQAMQQDFAAIGVKLEVTVEDWQTFLNDRKKGNYDVARNGWLADYDDPVNMLEMFMTESGNNDAQLGR